MSWYNSQQNVKLPVFKDKVMYINSSNNQNKIEQSYVISASFKGILRLSPNNYNTINERNPVELSIAEDASMSSSYSDAIVFESGSLKKSAKTNADIRERFIIASDSDGYLVNFRISDIDVEFDNLGVIGIAKTKNLMIYSDDNSSELGAFVLGNTLMPSLPNERENSRATLNSLIQLGKNNGKFEGKQYPEDFNEIEIDVTGSGDQSYLLYGLKDPKTGMRKFEYKRSQQFIRDVIMETLLSIQSVPTGSIHWLPVTFNQYATLIKQGKQYPNRSFTERNEYADPIIRDYLLCDGRKYRSYEFPELAKILWKENITYWDKNGDIKTHMNGGERVNKKTGETEYDEYFRVPDLRSKFITYVYAPTTTAPLQEPAEMNTYKKKDWNQTGLYTPDNSPYGSTKDGEHFHFQAYASYSQYNFKSVIDDDIYSFYGYKFDTDLSDLSKEARIWYLQTTAAGQSEKDGPGGFSYGFGSSGNRRRTPSTHDVITANAYVSAPGGGFNSFKKEPRLGVTSKSKSIYIIPFDNKETYKITKYDTWNNYIPIENNIQKNKLDYRYGYENAPKFYAFLPLIKI